jgi:putative AdoMet-dependent methyltransferase
LRNLEQTKALFDRWAAQYDEDLASPNGPLEGYEVSLRIAAELLTLPRSAVLLDIGIGTGAFAHMFEVQGPAAVHGIDLSEKMLDKCRELHPTYDLRVGTFQSIPYADETFDAVISSFCFHEVPPAERLSTCAEVYRVLRPGGRICLVDIMFASAASREEARRRIGPYWDDEEEYALVGDLNELLYRAGFRSTQWMQTGPYHWACQAMKAV